MNPDDIKKIKEYIEQGKLEEAGNLMEQVMSFDLSEREKGELLVTLTTLYTTMKLQSQEPYLETLKMVSEFIKQLSSMDTQISDAEGIVEARKRLSE